jgi:hypothetical protein
MAMPRSKLLFSMISLLVGIRGADAPSCLRSLKHLPAGIDPAAMIDCVCMQVRGNPKISIGSAP